MRIAITGSIACGKSTVLEELRRVGYPVVDADTISRDLTGPGGKALPEIRKVFGDRVFRGASLDRAAMGQLVFRNPDAKKQLEMILHPMISERLFSSLDAYSDHEMVFAEVPLLYETHLESRFDSVWVVATSEENQIMRLRERNNLSREQALARIHSQMPLSEKVALADAVIDTSGTLEATYAQIHRMLEELHAPPSEANPETEYALRMPPSRNRKSKLDSEPVRSPFLSPKTWLSILAAFLISVLFLGVGTIALRRYINELEIKKQLEVEAAERAQHPLLFPEFILPYAKKFDLDPALISSVILCESSYDPKAVSRLGARGLMQIMEDTGEWIAHRLHEDASYRFDQMFDPETNIRYGSWYLSYLYRRFQQDTVNTVCAYHAGQGNVDSWLKNAAYSKDGIHLDMIPTDDTAQYCRRVLHATEVYHKYYFPAETLSSADTKTNDAEATN